MKRIQRSRRSILLVEDDPVDLDLTNPLEVARDGEEASAWLPRIDLYGRLLNQVDG